MAYFKGFADQIRDLPHPHFSRAPNFVGALEIALTIIGIAS